ncbi:4Fe-4S dicluster domain-containing protein [Syntrophotalea carbinolica]
MSFYRGQTMFARIKIDGDRCKGCGLCTISCPRHLLYLKTTDSNSNHPVADIKDNGHCWGCAYCACICPDLAITVLSLVRNEITGRLSKVFPRYCKIVETLCCEL